MRAAFSRVSITPPDIEKNGTSMAGFYRQHRATEVLDDVMARAVLVEHDTPGNATKKLLLISLDLLKAPLLVFNYIKEKIQEEVSIGLGPGQIMISCTHTHHAPDLTGEYHWPGGLLPTIKGILFGHNRNDRYIVWFTRQIVKMVKQMVEKLEPVELAWTKVPLDDDKTTGDGIGPFIMNRRHPTDRTPLHLGVMAFKRAGKQEFAGILVNFGGHPIAISFENDKISADFPGRACRYIEEETGGKTAAIYFSGPSGDLNPITTCGTDFEAMEGKGAAMTANREEGKATSHYVQYGTEEDADRIGHYLGEQALSVAKAIPAGHFMKSIDSKSYLRLFRVPVKDMQEESKYGIYDRMNWLQNKLIVFIKKWVVLPISIHAAKEPNFPGLSVKKTPWSHGEGVKYHVYTINSYVDITGTTPAGENKRLGIIGVPGELFMDIKRRFLKRSPAGPDDTFIFQIANDWLGYLFPLKEYITKAGYEPFASTTPTAGPWVEEEMYRLWEEIEAGLVPFS